MLNEKKLYARSCMNESPLQSYIGCIADACKGGFWLSACWIPCIFLFYDPRFSLSLSGVIESKKQQLDLSDLKIEAVKARTSGVL
ncbi:hypothetical protein MRB53_024567 [Persea americana]|uniref:Uncharacterized protein n=1 Tax=Persea americana TaxID=3435 RepID=A0ACC2LDZ2_PERAE|nr:hypothetical protein MRB53_024567 [Persea americana]